MASFTLPLMRGLKQEKLRENHNNNRKTEKHTRFSIKIKLKSYDWALSHSNYLIFDLKKKHANKQTDFHIGAE